MRRSPCRVESPSSCSLCMSVWPFFLLLQVAEVVVQPVEPLVPEHLVLGHPVMERTQGRGIQVVQTSAPHRATPDKPHLAEHPQVLGHLRLRDRKVVDDHPDRLLTGNEHIEDVATVHLGDRVEDVGGGGSPGHPHIICLYRNMSTACVPRIRIRPKDQDQYGRDFGHLLATAACGTGGSGAARTPWPARGGG